MILYEFKREGVFQQSVYGKSQLILFPIQIILHQVLSCGMLIITFHIMRKVESEWSREQ